MNERECAEKFFWIMMHCKKNLSQIPQDCSQGETGVLSYLAFEQNKITPSELSENIGVSLPRMVSVLNALEVKKLIIKNIDNIDKRKTIVEITEQGKKVVENKKEEAISKISKILEKLEDEEVNEYLRLIEKILKIIEDIQE